jgi:hypothetical protein
MCYNINAIFEQFYVYTVLYVHFYLLFLKLISSEEVDIIFLVLFQLILQVKISTFVLLASDRALQDNLPTIHNL